MVQSRFVKSEVSRCCCKGIAAILQHKALRQYQTTSCATCIIVCHWSVQPKQLTASRTCDNSRNAHGRVNAWKVSSRSPAEQGSIAYVHLPIAVVDSRQARAKAGADNGSAVSCVLQKAAVELNTASLQSLQSTQSIMQQQPVKSCKAHHFTEVRLCCNSRESPNQTLKSRQGCSITK